MNSNPDVSSLFFTELKKYNLTNFKCLEKADLTQTNPIVHKAFSSVITRYFIFCERHPELTDVDKRLLYYKLKLDIIAKYFSEYPDSDISNLKAFQDELKIAIKKEK